MAQTYYFGNSSFKNELWINQKKVFKNLHSANVEFISGGQWDWLIADSTGQVIKTLSHNGGGWTSIDLPSLGLHGDYSLGFKNLSGDTKSIKSGDVSYD